MGRFRDADNQPQRECSAARKVTLQRDRANRARIEDLQAIRVRTMLPNSETRRVLVR
jgi:hypothetical protein